MAPPVHFSQIQLRFSMFLFRRAPVPSDSLDFILLHTLASRVHKSQANLCMRMSLLSGEQEPIDSLRCILVNTSAVSILQPYGNLCGRVSFLRSFTKPVDGLCFVFMTGGRHEFKGEDIIVIQTKTGRLGMYLMGQAYFSREIMKRYHPRSIRTVAICGVSDPEMEAFCERAGIEVCVIPEAD